jgi:hypothetical protein
MMFRFGGLVEDYHPILFDMTQARSYVTYAYVGVDVLFLSSLLKAVFV